MRSCKDTCCFECEHKGNRAKCDVDIFDCPRSSKCIDKNIYAPCDKFKKIGSVKFEENMK